MSEQYGSRPSAEAQSNSELVKHEVTELTEVSPEVVAAVKEASSMVWEHNIGKPTVMGYIFARRILNPKTGEDTGASAVYEPDGDKFLFALDTIKEQTRSLSIDQELILFIFAAHEATHKVQVSRGDSPRLSPLTPDADALYKADPHEREAWIESLHAFKKRYPFASGSFTQWDNTYTVPEKSKYDQ